MILCKGEEAKPGKYICQARPWCRKHQNYNDEFMRKNHLNSIVTLMRQPSTATCAHFDRIHK